MTFKQVACVLLVCDECDSAFRGYEDMLIHFDDTEKGRADALRDATEDDPDGAWEVGERHVCRMCIEKRPHRFERFGDFDLALCRFCSRPSDDARHTVVRA